MFKKSKTPEGGTARAEQAGSSTTPAPFSILSSDLRFDGNITGAGDLQIDEIVKGDVSVARLIVGETGSIEGSINAQYLEVRGRTTGGIVGKKVALMGTGYVEGDVTAEQLTIESGAYFQGRVVQPRRDVAPITVQQSSPTSEGTRVTLNAERADPAPAAPAPSPVVAPAATPIPLYAAQPAPERPADPVVRQDAPSSATPLHHGASGSSAVPSGGLEPQDTAPQVLTPVKPADDRPQVIDFRAH